MTENVPAFAAASFCHWLHLLAIRWSPEIKYAPYANRNAKMIVETLKGSVAKVLCAGEGKDWESGMGNTFLCYRGMQYSDEKVPFSIIVWNECRFLNIPALFSDDDVVMSGVGHLSAQIFMVLALQESTSSGGTSERCFKEGDSSAAV